MTEKLLEIPAGEFKARCLKLMDEVRETPRPGQLHNDPVDRIFGRNGPHRRP